MRAHEQLRDPVAAAYARGMLEGWSIATGVALLALALASLVGCSSRAPTCADMRRDPQRYCPDLTNDTGPCDPRTPLQRACCCGDGRPPCEVR